MCLSTLKPETPHCIFGDNLMNHQSKAVREVWKRSACSAQWMARVTSHCTLPVTFSPHSSPLFAMSWFTRGALLQHVQTRTGSARMRAHLHTYPALPLSDQSQGDLQNSRNVHRLPKVCVREIATQHHRIWGTVAGYCRWRTSSVTFPHRSTPRRPQGAGYATTPH